MRIINTVVLAVMTGASVLAMPTTAECTIAGALRRWKLRTARVVWP